MKYLAALILTLAAVSAEAQVQSQLQYLAQTDLLQYSPNFTRLANDTNRTAAFQNWLLATYIQYHTLNPNQYNQSLTRLSCIKAEITYVGSISLTSPIVIPPGVCLDANTLLQRKVGTASFTSNFAGLTYGATNDTINGLSNPWQPMLIFPPGAQNIMNEELLTYQPYGASTSGATIATTGTAGQFSCSGCTSLNVGQLIKVSGTNSGTGSITGYSNPTTYQISANTGSTAFTFNDTSGNAITTVAGSLTGLTFTEQNVGGSGNSWGRVYQLNTLTVAAGGTGYTNGDTCTTANGDIALPYVGATFTITASGGVVSAVTFSPSHWTTAAGLYSMPLAMAQSVWTTANGWSNVFDGSGNFQTTCNAGGSGLTVTATMFPDWSTGSTTYYGTNGNSNTPTDSWYGRSYARQSRKTTSSVYGPTIGQNVDGFSVRWDELYSETMQIGFLFTGADHYGNRCTSIGNAQGFVWNAGGDFQCALMVSNNDTQNTLVIDHWEGMKLPSVRIFFDNQTTPTATTASVLIGSKSSAGNPVQNLTANFLLENSGSVSGQTAMTINYLCGSTIDAQVDNLYNSTTPDQSQMTSWATFGSGNCADNVFRGSINNQTGTIMQGTVPNGSFSIYNGATGTIFTSNPPTIAGGFSAGGTAASIGTTSGVNSFTINVGTGTMSSAGILTMPFAAQHGWACWSNVTSSDYASYNTAQSFSNTTSVTLTNYSRTTGLATAWTASDTIEAGCFPN